MSDTDKKPEEQDIRHLVDNVFEKMAWERMLLLRQFLVQREAELSRLTREAGNTGVYARAQCELIRYIKKMIG